MTWANSAPLNAPEEVGGSDSSRPEMSMRHQVIATYAALLFALCCFGQPEARAFTSLVPTLGKIVAKTLVETGTTLALTETYDQLKKALLTAIGSGSPGAPNTDYGISNLNIDLLSHTDSRFKRVKSIRQYETRSVQPNPATGGLSYFRLLTAGYTNAGLPQSTSSSSEPFEFNLRDLSESCANPDLGLEYRRTMSTKLLARHSYLKAPAIKPGGYILSLGLGHAPLPSEAPCSTGVSGPPAGTANLLFSLVPNGAAVLTLPASIQPNAVTAFWLAAALIAPRGTGTL